MNRKERLQYEKLVLTPIPRLIPALSAPTILSMMISMIYNLVDAYYVGKLGTSASAAIGIMISVQAVFQAVGFMCGHGCGSSMSRMLGEGREEEAHNFVSTGFFTALFTGASLAVPGLVFRTRLMLLLGSTPTILPYAKSYGFYILLAGPAFAASAVLNNVLRYEGKAMLAMIGLVSGGVLNMAADPLFMFRFHMGIDGAGLATAMSQYISFGILLYMFLSKRSITQISLKRFSPRSRYLRETIKNGVPSLLRQMLMSISTATLNICAAPYGDAAIAAMTIVGRVGMFIGSVMIGIGQGFQPVAAYNYGAGKFRRVRDGFCFTLFLGEGMLCLFAAAGFLFPARIVKVFRDDAEVVRIGVFALRCQCVAAVLQPLSVAANMLFQSIGQSKTASLLASLRSGICYIPVLIVAPRFFGVAGIQSAQAVADFLTVCVCLPFVLSFLKTLPRENRRTHIDALYDGKA